MVNFVSMHARYLHKVDAEPALYSQTVQKQCQQHVRVT